MLGTAASPRTCTLIPNLPPFPGGYDERADEAFLAETTKAINTARASIVAELPSLGQELHDGALAVLAGWERLIPAQSEQRGAWSEWASAQSAFTPLLATTVLLFTFRRRHTTVDAALEIANALGDAATTVHQEQAAGRDPQFGNATVDAAFNRIGAALGEFARRANSDIRRWWL